MWGSDSNNISKVTSDAYFWICVIFFIKCFFTDGKTHVQIE